MRGRARSSANLVAPVTFATASTFRSAFPTTRRTDWRLSALSAIQRLPRRARVFPPHPGRRQLDRLVDLDVTGAAAQVAGQRRLDRVARRARVLLEERLG